MSQSNDFSYHLMDDEPDFLIETGKAYRSVQNLDKFLAKVRKINAHVATVSLKKFHNLFAVFRRCTVIIGEKVFGVSQSLKF